MDAATFRKRRGAAAILSLLLALAVACGEDVSVGSDAGMTVEEIQEDQYFYEGEYLGQTVTISAAVSQVLAADRIEVNGGSHGDESLLVIARHPLEVALGDMVRITGTVGQYHVTMEAEGVPPVQYDMYEKYETEAYLSDATVEPIGGGGAP
ncbi:MAG: hypothetical protein ACRDXB_13755 [Actinomycetes bacterium]